MAIFNFGTAPFSGSLGSMKLNQPVVAMATVGPAIGGHALLVGTFDGIPGQYQTIQDAVNAAQPGDWILIAPGDYHEQADHLAPPSAQRGLTRMVRRGRDPYQRRPSSGNEPELGRRGRHQARCAAMQQPTPPIRISGRLELVQRTRSAGTGSTSGPTASRSTTSRCATSSSSRTAQGTRPGDGGNEIWWDGG